MGVIHSKEYIIEGMTCMNCVRKVSAELESIPNVSSTEIKLSPESSFVNSLHPVNTETLQSALDKIGNYSIHEKLENRIGESQMEEPNGLLRYKPLLLIFAFIFGTTILLQFNQNQFDFMQWMRHFMAGFFIVFSFFKLLDLKGFANSFRMYDVVAQKIPLYGLVYPFLELGLGIAFILWVNPKATLISALILMIVGTIGVLQSVVKKERIQCACLGTVFNLPMSKVTIIENSTMIFMSIWMLLQ